MIDAIANPIAIGRMNGTTGVTMTLSAPMLRNSSIIASASSGNGLHQIL